MNINRIPEKGKSASSQDLSASFETSAFYLERMKGFSILLVKTGDAEGAFSLQCSNNAFLDNANGDANDAATWVTIDGSQVSVTGDDEIIWHSPDSYYEAVRVVWDQTAGTGTASIYFLAKAESP